MAGSASCTIEMAECLQKQGIDVTIAGILREGANYEHNGVKYYHLGNTFDLTLHLPLIRKEKFNVIQLLRAGYLTQVSEHFPGAKIIVRLGDVFFLAHETTPSQINDLTDKVIAVSSYVKESAIKWGINEEKITIVPVGIRTDIFCRSSKISRQENLLMFAGATIPEKGIFLLLDAFRKIGTSIPDARLEIYGAESLWGRKNEIPWMSIQRNNPEILYKGAQHKQELSIAFNRSKLCIVPSLIPEGFTRVSIEAQACGCPVVCSDAGGLPETLLHRETGYVIDHICPDNLASTLIDLLSDASHLKAMSGKAAEHAAKYSVENSTHAFMQVVANLI